MAPIRSGAAVNEGPPSSQSNTQIIFIFLPCQETRIELEIFWLLWSQWLQSTVQIHAALQLNML